MLFSIVVGDGSVARFWDYVWCGGVLFKTQFHRLFSLSLLKDGLVSDFWTFGGWNFLWRCGIRGGVETEQLESLMQILTPIQLTSIPNNWSWSLDPSGVFSVSSMRRYIDSISLLISGVGTRWNRNCETACQIWRRLGVWLDVSFPIDPSVSEMFDWIDSLVIVRRHRSILELICMASLWVIWSYRNGVIFSLNKFKKHLLYDTIVDLSFRWFSLRKSKACVSWIDWMCNPLMT
uniref:Reverse transcriptase zinc-binding domain-containing protein n=1 Tax=Lactuca sativa TaxID=4236 RepID=A0A9R1W5H6_LACSA|nr:hypothetical protein LSAT_V11C300119760 [Lactuca sativa]